MSLERLKVGELLGGDLNEVQQEAHDPRELQTVEGDLNEVWREAHNPRELRAVRCAEQSPGSPKKIAALLGELNYPSTHKYLPISQPHTPNQVKIIEERDVR